MFARVEIVCNAISDDVDQNKAPRDWTEHSAYTETHDEKKKKRRISRLSL